MDSLSIGQLAKQTDIGLETIRFYGGEPPSVRSIRTAKGLGFSLKILIAALAVTGFFSLQAPGYSAMARTLPASASAQRTESQWLDQLIAVLNSGSIPTISQFGDSAGRDPGYLYSLHQEFGPLSRGPNSMGAYWLRGTVTHAWVGFEITQTDTGFRLNAVLRGVRPEGEARPETVPDEELPTYLDRYLRESSAQGYFSGAVAVARNDEVLFQGAYGLADRGRGTPNAIGTPFSLASVTKVFIGVAIAQLAQRGLLSFDDPLARFIPEYPRAIGEKVTLHHLLTHTSGIELDDYADYNEAVAEAHSLDDLLAAQLRFAHLLQDEDGGFTLPGGFDYTNEGIDLLGVVIERAGGKPWRTYLAEEVFEPAQMTQTGFFDASSPVPNLAKGYSVRDESFDFLLGERREIDTATELTQAARPAGSSYSTVIDMMRFVRALYSGSLLDEEHREIVMRPHVETVRVGNLSRAYGYCLEVDRFGNVLAVGHSGGAPGVSTQFTIYPESGYVVIVLSNFDRSSARNVSAHIQEILVDVGTRRGGQQ